MSILEKARLIQGWMNEAELDWLSKYARISNIIVEFGSFQGRSTRALADNLPENGKLYAVDTWGGRSFKEDGSQLNVTTLDDMKVFCINLRDHIDSGRVIPTCCKAKHFVMKEKADMVFIDADHRYAAVMEDIQKAMELLRNGGIISGHDYNRDDWPGVKRAVLDSFASPVQTCDSIWWCYV